MIIGTNTQLMATRTSALSTDTIAHTGVEGGAVDYPRVLFSDPRHPPVFEGGIV